MTDPIPQSPHQPILAEIRSPELGGDVPCYRCGYDLQGVSVRANCPECGLPVRATILAIVDPRASELRPLTHPRITVFGLVLWTHAVCAAYVGIPIAISLAVLHFRSQAAMCLSTAVAWLSILCAIGTFMMWKPHDGISRLRRIAAAVGAAGFVLAGLSLIGLRPISYSFTIVDLTAFSKTVVPLHHALAVFHAFHALSVLLIRPIVRDLAGRSLLMRSGTVNRQTLAATSAVLAIAAVGYGLVALTSMDHLPSIFGMIGLAFAVTGTILLAVGGFGLAVDAWRLAPVLMEPPKRLSSIIRVSTQHD